MHVRRFAGVIAVHREQIVLVRERHDQWGGEFWNVVAPDDLRLVSTSATASGPDRALAWNFTTVVDSPSCWQPGTSEAFPR